jgi:hypothetical protein
MTSAGAAQALDFVDAPGTSERCCGAREVTCFNVAALLSAQAKNSNFLHSTKYEFLKQISHVARE